MQNSLNLPSLLAALLIAALALSPVSAFAEVKPEKKPAKAEKTYEGDYETLESYGLWRRPSEGGLGRDLWNKTPRSAILGALSVMPDQIEDPIQQQIAFGVLLSETNARLIENDIAVTSGKDLLTLRLQKLLEMGAYPQAAELFTMIDDTAYHPDLAFAGITALLASGQKSLACLEAKSAQEKFAHDRRFAQASAYCDLDNNEELRETAQDILKDAQSDLLERLGKGRDIDRSYDADDFQKLSSFELGILGAQQAIELDDTKTSDLRAIPPQHVLLLLTQDKLSEKQRFLLTEQAVRWGLKSYEDLQELSKETDIPAENTPEWLELAAFYQQLSDAARGQNSWNILTQAFAATPQDALYRLFPFANHIESARTDQATLSDMRIALQVLVYTGQEISDDWLDLLKSRQDARNDEPALYDALLTALYTAAPKYNRESRFEGLDSKLLKGGDKIVHSNKNKAALLGIIDYAQHSQADSAQDSLIYEKRFYLTSTSNYVMPTYRVWDRLRRAADGGRIGETILLSSIILRNLAPGGDFEAKGQELYPGLLRDILLSLDKTGLTNVSRQLALAIALKQYNEE